MAQGRALKLGETGTIETTVQRRGADKVWHKAPTKWRTGDRVRARAYHRGMDGKVREISRVAATKTDAIEAVRASIMAAPRGENSSLTPATKVGDAVAVWLVQANRADSGLSTRSLALYEGAARLHVLDSSISALRLDQLNPSNLRRFLQELADESGTSTAKVSRSVLSGVIGLALGDGVLTSDPLRALRAVRSDAGEKPKAADHTRAFTRQERDALIAHLDARAMTPGLPARTARKFRAVADLLAFLAGTGVRVEEARSLLWSDVDLPGKRVLVRGTKSRAALRTLSLPAWLADRLEATWGEGQPLDGYVFASATGRKWDQSNSAHAIRDALDYAGYPWAVSHTFRRTVATLSHEAGVPLVRIADQLGHADPGMTASVYLGRDFMGERSDIADAL